LTSGTQARADWRGLFSAALLGSGIALGLGVTYLNWGLAGAIEDHSRAARIAQAAEGGFSETMLQREMDRMNPAALRLAQAHDGLTADGGRESAQAWLTGPDERLAAVRHSSALDSARQLDCLTQAVYFEARGETPRGQAAVAQVVMNRVKNPSFPKTVCGVVFQGAASHGCQFSFACDGSMRHGLETSAWDRARRIAERTLSGARLADIGSATHFHTTSVQPYWVPQMLRVAQVGLHVFYRFNPHAPVARPMDENRAVFVSLPIGPVTNIRLANAVLQKTADATVAATGLATSASAEVKLPAKPAEPAAAAAQVSAAQASAADSAVSSDAAAP
jgi:spore germination cell wall hydrolase CwlJ-like protein